MHRLHAPAALDELNGQPIEQLGMRWTVTLAPEVICRGDDASAEVSLPEAIHHHAREQRLTLRRHPQSQRLAPLRNERALGWLRHGPAAQGGQESGFDFGTLLLEIAAYQDV